MKRSYTAIACALLLASSMVLVGKEKDKDKDKDKKDKQGALVTVCRWYPSPQMTVVVDQQTADTLLAQGDYTPGSCAPQ